MDSAIRELERKLRSNPDDFETRYAYTHKLLQSGCGYFIFWRGVFLDKNVSQYCVLTQVEYQPREEISFKEKGYVLGIVGLDDLLVMAACCPDGILQLPEGKYTSLKKISPFPLECLVKNELPQNKWPKIPYRWIYSQPLYDREVLLPGKYGRDSQTYDTQTLRFFRTALGSVNEKSEYDNAPCKRWRKDFSDTNMDVAGSLPYPKHFRMTGISLIPDPTANMEEFKALMEGSWCRIILGTFSYFEKPAHLVAGIQDSTSPQFAFKLSGPIGCHEEFAQPEELIPQRNFWAELVMEKPVTLTQELGILCVLWGSFIREYV